MASNGSFTILRGQFSKMERKSFKKRGTFKLSKDYETINILTFSLFSASKLEQCWHSFTETNIEMESVRSSFSKMDSCA